MALGTFEFPVLADQLILCIPLVIKLEIRFPGLHPMALGTILLRIGTHKVVYIVFFVAGNAARFQTKIMGFIGPKHVLKLRPLHSLFLVTFQTLDLGMFSLKDITRF